MMGHGASPRKSMENSQWRVVESCWRAGAASTRAVLGAIPPAGFGGAAALAHVRDELAVLLFPNANAQLCSRDAPELTHSATQQIHGGRRGTAKELFQELKELLTPNCYYAITVFLSLRTLGF